LCEPGVANPASTMHLESVHSMPKGKGATWHLDKMVASSTLRALLSCEGLSLSAGIISAALLVPELSHTSLQA